MVLARSRRDFLKQSSALAALTAVGPAWAQTQSSRDVEADTAFGRVRGTDVDGIKTFKGIPYGASTAGANRFMPPLDPAKWRGVRDALEYGPSAPQREPGTQPAAGPLAVAGAGLPPEGEDCLVLNVWTPGVDDRGKRPVMVWCHGGGFATGSGSSPGTDGTNLARRGDVVVVSINHRLNVLGFTYLAELHGHPQSGDAGMLDIVHALEVGAREHRRVRRRSEQRHGIRPIGRRPQGRDAARHAVREGAIPSRDHRERRDDQARRAGASRARRDRARPHTRVAYQCRRRSLQGLPIDLIMKAYFATVRSMNVDQMTMGFSPTVDGAAVPTHPFHPTAADVSADVPLIIGSTRTELTSSADDASVRARRRWDAQPDRHAARRGRRRSHRRL